MKRVMRLLPLFAGLLAIFGALAAWAVLRMVSFSAAAWVALALAAAFLLSASVLVGWALTERRRRFAAARAFNEVLRVRESAPAVKDTRNDSASEPDEPDAPPQPAPSAPGAGAALTDAVLSALADATLEISLQPVFAMPSGETAGFCTFGAVTLPNGEVRHIQDFDDPEHETRALFEYRLFALAAAASRQILQEAHADAPVFCPVSPALFETPALVSSIAGLVKAHPALARQLILKLDRPENRFAGEARARLRQLQREGLRCAVPMAGRDVNGRSMSPAYQFCDCDRFLAGGPVPRSQDEAAQTLIVNGVVTAEQVLALIDTGVTMMAGQHFSPPRRIRQPLVPKTDTMVARSRKPGAK